MTKRLTLRTKIKDERVSTTGNVRRSPITDVERPTVTPGTFIPTTEVVLSPRNFYKEKEVVMANQVVSDPLPFFS